MRVEMVAWKLAQVFTRTGIPKKVVTDQRTSSMNEVLQSVWWFLGCSPYKPQYITNKEMDW